MAALLKTIELEAQAGDLGACHASRTSLAAALKKFPCKPRYCSHMIRKGRVRWVAKENSASSPCDGLAPPHYSLLGGSPPPSAKVRSMRSFFCTLACAAALLASGELSGRRAPGFSLPDMNLKQYDLQDYRGKIVLIDIMQTRCPHCATFSTILEEVAARYKGRVAVLSIVNPPDTTATVQQYVRQNNVSTPILFDCGQVSSSYYKATPQHADINVPHLFMVDPRGVIQNDYAYGPLTKGIFEDRDLFGELDRMLAKTK